MYTLKSIHCLRTYSTCALVAVAVLERGLYPFIVFKPLSYCFEEAI